MKGWFRRFVALFWLIFPETFCMRLEWFILCFLLHGGKIFPSNVRENRRQRVNTIYIHEHGSIRIPWIPGVYANKPKMLRFFRCANIFLDLPSTPAVFANPFWPAWPVIMSKEKGRQRVFIGKKTGPPNWFWRTFLFFVSERSYQRHFEKPGVYPQEVLEAGFRRKILCAITSFLAPGSSGKPPAITENELTLNFLEAQCFFWSQSLRTILSKSGIKMWPCIPRRSSCALQNLHTPGLAEKIYKKTQRAVVLFDAALCTAGGESKRKLLGNIQVNFSQGFLVNGWIDANSRFKNG